MAPIDPNSLLRAFEPWLTPEGGIRNIEEVPRLSSLMKKYSKKLVSRCIYLNVLMNTKEEVMKMFLEQDGWDTINNWLNMAKDANNHPFLLEILKLLERCPVTIDRLKQNNTAKLIKGMTKEGHEDVVAGAKKLVNLWTSLIQTQNGEAEKKKLKKDKKIKRTTDTDVENVSRKKRKVDVVDAKFDNSQNKDNGVSLDGSISENSNDSNHRTLGLTPRAPTVKVRQNTTRSIGVLEPTALVDSGSKVVNTSRATGTVSSTLKTVTVPASTGLNKVISSKLKLDAQTKDKPGIKLIDAKPMPAAATSPTISGKPVLTESAGFMDAIQSESTAVRKKKKITNKSDKRSEGSNSPPDPADALDITTRIEMDMQANINDDATDELYQEDNENDTTPSDSESRSYTPPLVVTTMTTSTLTPGPSKSFPRGCLLLTRSNKKKGVRWLPEACITAVQYFDVDENERTNVFREALNQQMDNKGEGQAFLKKNYSSDKLPIEKFKWKPLIPITLPEGLPVVDEHGKNSKEKEIQAQKHRTTLAEFCPSKDMAADFPQEPDVFEALAGAHEVPKVIPLEDASNPGACSDYSMTPLPQPKTGVPGQLPAAFQASGSFSPGPSLVSSTYSNTAVPQYDQFNSAPSSAFTQHEASSYQQQPATQFQSTYIAPPSGMTNRIRPSRPQQNFVRRGRGGGRGGGGPPPICRHFLSTGNCRYQRCNFIHTRDANQMLTRDRDVSGGSRTEWSAQSNNQSNDDNWNTSADGGAWNSTGPTDTFDWNTTETSYNSV